MSAGAGVSGDPPGIDGDFRAAEYVLGTLPLEERVLLERLRATDPAIQAEVGFWERRLAPLGLSLAEVEPPKGVWQRIASALDAAGPASAAANDNRLAALTSQVRRWRIAATGAGLLAAGLALYVATGLQQPVAPEAARYVAVVQSGGAVPALIVSVDTKSGTAQVRPVGAETPSGRSLQLWYVGAGAAPKPLAVLGGETSRVTVPPEAVKSGEGVFAVSVEPPGGSPTGAPTGQVVSTGKLIRE